jgi:hypothetical protein
MAPIKFETFRDTQSKSALQKMMKDAVTAAAGKGKVHYVVAKNYKTPVKKETLSVFVIVDQAHQEQFKTLLKTSGGAVSKGQASVVKETKDNKVTNKVIIYTAEGALGKDRLETDIKSVSALARPTRPGLLAARNRKKPPRLRKTRPSPSPTRPKWFGPASPRPSARASSNPMRPTARWMCWAGL